jgi:hypothetical protein
VLPGSKKILSAISSSFAGAAGAPVCFVTDPVRAFVRGSKGRRFSNVQSNQCPEFLACILLLNRAGRKGFVECADLCFSVIDTLESPPLQKRRPRGRLFCLYEQQSTLQRMPGLPREMSIGTGRQAGIAEREQSSDDVSGRARSVRHLSLVHRPCPNRTGCRNCLIRVQFCPFFQQPSGNFLNVFEDLTKRSKSCCIFPHPTTIICGKYTVYH